MPVDKGSKVGTPDASRCRRTADIGGLTYFSPST
jgi:hypothetical protein